MRRTLLLVVVSIGVAAATLATVARSGGTPVALVTAETENELLAVNPWSGQVLRRVHVPADPENVAATGDAPVVVVSTRGAAVTLLDWRTLEPLAVIHGFGSPHIPAIAADHRHAYVTDDARGQLDVVDLTTRAVTRRVTVGPRAHHLAVDPAGNSVWVALGETAHTIVILDTSHTARPKVIRRLHSPVAVHDLAFAPDGAGVWITSATAPYVTIVAASTGKQIRRIRAGPAPQHLAFDPSGRYAYITSGYGGSIEQVSVATGRILRRTAVPYGSFNVATGGGLVITTSLTRGTLTLLDDQLRVRHTAHIAPAARDAAMTAW